MGNKVYNAVVVVVVVSCRFWVDILHLISNYIKALSTRRLRASSSRKHSNQTRGLFNYTTRKGGNQLRSRISPVGDLATLEGKTPQWVSQPEKARPSTRSP